MPEDDFYPDYRRLNDLAYTCQNCRRELKFAMVELMGKIEGESFFISHKCSCAPSTSFEQNYRVEHTALRRLLGGLRPVLPYRAAPHPPLSLRPEMEKQLTVFRWEVEALLSVEEFELFCTRPPL